MKHTALLAAIAALLFANQSANAQGALNPPGAPAESQKSLQEIYDAIQSAKADFADLVQQAVPSVPGMVTVLGGILPEESGLAGEKAGTFYLGKYEMTWGEWQEVRAWAVANGYNDLINVGSGSAENHPVRDVSFFDILKWINAKSEMDGFLPVYKIGTEVYRNGENMPSLDRLANGYRLPNEVEWEWAARGGVYSNGYIYSGSNDLDSVAWHGGNSNQPIVDLSEGLGTWSVGTKQANELGIFDMSGNVWEWTWSANTSIAQLRGGSFYDRQSGFLTVSRREDSYSLFLRPPNKGFRIAKSY